MRRSDPDYCWEPDADNDEDAPPPHFNEPDWSSAMEGGDEAEEEDE